MPNRIKPKRSYTANSVPLTSDLDTHELAIRWDGSNSAMFTKDAAGNIVSVTLGGSGGSGEDAVLRALFVPAAPTSVTAAAGNAQATVSWTAPTGVIAQAPITDYVVQFSTNSGSTWTTFADGTSTATSATVTGLANGTAVQFRVAATNGVGTGAYSTASSSVTPSAATVPGVPTNLRRATTHWACGNDNEIAWNAPVSNGGSAITGYRWRINSGGTTTLVSPASGSRDQATNYTGGVVLSLPTGGSFQVAAVNAAGTGEYASITLQGDCN